MKVKLLSRVQLFATPWTTACQASSFLGFSRQENWSGLPCPSPEDLPGPGIKPGSPALQADAFPSEPPGKPIRLLKDHNMQHASKNQHVNKRNFHSSMHSLMNHFFKKTKFEPGIKFIQTTWILYPHLGAVFYEGLPICYTFSLHHPKYQFKLYFLNEFQ